MNDEITQLVTELFPYVTAAIGAYGISVLDKIKEDSAVATVDWGRQALQRIFGTRADVPDSIRDLAEDPDNEDLHAVLRAAISEALYGDDEMAQDVRVLTDAARAQPDRHQRSLIIKASASSHAQQAIQGYGAQTNTFKQN